MSQGKKRKITTSLLTLAGATIVIALCLAAIKKDSGVVPISAPDTPPVDPPIITKPTKPNVATTIEPVKKPPQQPKVDVVFVLDTTGSMSGLINGAKRKIWSIANQIVNGNPRPHVRIGLIGYRDLGDNYVTRRYDLTEEIDDVHLNLKRFRAGGGGDTPEHVNRALFEAVNKMQWRKGQNVLRQIYLVGDAPPHEGRDGLYSRALARQAHKKGIIINAVRCGRMSATETIWRRIALAAGGQYASIRQDGAMVALSTPMDDRLTKLNAALSATLLPTGSARDKAAVRRRAHSNRSMEGFAQAESAAFRARSGKLDSKDLLTVVKRGKKLSDIKEAELPVALKAVAPPKRKAYMLKIAKKRQKIKQEIVELSKKRAAYLKTKRKPKAATSFDDTIGRALKAQGKRAGIAY